MEVDQWHKQVGRDASDTVLMVRSANSCLQHSQSNFFSEMRSPWERCSPTNYWGSMDHNKGKHSDGGAPGMVVLHKGGVTGNSVSWKTRIELKQSPTTAVDHLAYNKSWPFPQKINYKDLVDV